MDTAVFGGSNGYWRREALKRVRFDPSMMTEDIDATSRALLEGFHLCADRSIVSTELAPGNFRSLWFQRKRWAQGWLEVSFKHQRQLWTTRNLNFGQKAYWTYLLFFMQSRASKVIPGGRLWGVAPRWVQALEVQRQGLWEVGFGDFVDIDAARRRPANRDTLAPVVGSILRVDMDAAAEELLRH